MVRPRLGGLLADFFSTALPLRFILLFHFVVFCSFVWVVSLLLVCLGVWVFFCATRFEFFLVYRYFFAAFLFGVFWFLVWKIWCVLFSFFSRYWCSSLYCCWVFGVVFCFGPEVLGCRFFKGVESSLMVF